MTVFAALAQCLRCAANAYCSQPCPRESPPAVLFLYAAGPRHEVRRLRKPQFPSRRPSGIAPRQEPPGCVPDLGAVVDMPGSNGDLVVPGLASREASRRPRSIKDKICQWEGRKRAGVQEKPPEPQVLEPRALQAEEAQEVPEPGRGAGRAGARWLGATWPGPDPHTVLTQVQRLERALQDGSAGLDPQLPGTCYSAPGLARKMQRSPPPKPRRTFEHAGCASGIQGRGPQRGRRPPLPPLPPPPLPESPPPGVVSRRRGTARPRPSADHRKSYEFEDLLQGPSENSHADWYAQSRLGRTRTLSEENVYEDILDPPMKENPYEDIELHGRCLGKKCVLTSPASPTSSIPDTPTKSLAKPAFFWQNSERRNFRLLDMRKLSRDGAGSPPKTSPPSTPSSPDDITFNLGDLQNGRRKRKIPKLVLRINAIYEARRGKKRVKRLSQSTESGSGKAHSQRLVNVQSRLKQAPHYPARELLECQERQLFEYFVVVSLHRKQAGAAYVPKLTQQFPLKLERSFTFTREAEDQLKAIPQFCFPDAKDWAPVQQFTSETFSFVLTGEDGSRRFGYCRRLLPGGKGKRLPEVYCIVSRLGCFSLFSKILDEVEKRRGISPALVQPLMRSVLEAPFPALGKTIVVKNFLPGSGTEVIELCRPLDSRLEHVDFESLFSALSVRHLVCVFASLLLERRVIFIADKLSTLSKCCHAMVALIYPFRWQHTYIPVLPPAMVDIVCSPTPFLVGLLASSLPLLRELPLEECEHGPECSPLSQVVSEAFVRFFVELVGHYPLFLTTGTGEREERALQREAFRKAVSSKSLRHFLEVFMETQTFRGFMQERELCRQDAKGLFEVRAQEYLETLPSGEHSGVNRFLKGLGNKMKFLHKK
ncbi:DENN domain-containing protein 2A [Octodon degus]|uniref:DENN domain-containing protein 2A n=1 Tax=Octodon degus TaxID=10160 RepID=A0A6P6E917_OCTDE|nr:DENN domain-containing protein 2A [Octodon degus]